MKGGLPGFFPVIRDQCLERRKLQFSGLITTAVWLRHSEFCSAQGTLFPIAPCGLPSPEQLRHSSSAQEVTHQDQRR